MESLKKLLKLELLGWLFIVLSLFNLPSLPLQWGALLVLASKVCKAWGLNCGLCKDSCSKE